MGVNFEKFKKLINENYGAIGFQVIEDKEYKLKMAMPKMTIKPFKGKVQIYFTIFENGTTRVHFVFDEIEETFEALKLMNTFNRENNWLRVYTVVEDGKHFLRVSYVTKGGMTDDITTEVFKHVTFAFDKITNEEVQSYLKPITDLTFVSK